MRLCEMLVPGLKPSHAIAPKKEAQARNIPGLREEEKKAASAALWYGESCSTL